MKMSRLCHSSASLMHKDILPSEFEVIRVFCPPSMSMFLLSVAQIESNSTLFGSCFEQWTLSQRGLMEIGMERFEFKCIPNEISWDINIILLPLFICGSYIKKKSDRNTLRWVFFFCSCFMQLYDCQSQLSQISQHMICFLCQQNWAKKCII